MDAGTANKNGQSESGHYFHELGEIRMVDIPKPGFSQETVDEMVSFMTFASRNALRMALWGMTVLGELAVGAAIFGVRGGENAWPVVIGALVAALPGIAGEINLNLRGGER